MKQQPDILLIMSDQHAGYYIGSEGGMVDTPALDRLAAGGVRFANHYTSCPLCVPARMSFLSGQLPTRVGVTNNNMTLAETDPTFLFPLVAAGYETVLIGRMHFIGKDQRHGFTKRIGTDMTPTCWAPQWKAMGEERGSELIRAFSSGGCLNFIGAGESPVRYYDEMIAAEALSYLAQPHDKPQCIIVGTFGPHFPYIADEALYRKYLERGYLSPLFDVSEPWVQNNPFLAAHVKDTDEDTARCAAAAYCAMIEESDRQVGRILDAFHAYTAQSGRPAIYGYTSDHGDTVGARRMYGKQTFFEDSVRIPLLLAGDGIPANTVIRENTSIMDIGPTLCALAGTAYEGRRIDGISLLPLLQGDNNAFAERPVLSQYMESLPAKEKGAAPTLCYSIMVRRANWKYVTYHGQEESSMLFDMDRDPLERTNLYPQMPKIAHLLHDIVMQAADPAEEELAHADRCRMHRWLAAYEQAAGWNDEERWKDNPPTAKGQNIIR